MTEQPSEQEWDAVPPGSVPPPPPYGTPPAHGRPPGHGPAPYGSAPYGQLPAYGPAPYGQPPAYGPVPYGPVPYGAVPHVAVPPYGQPAVPGWVAVPLAPPAWPHGPGRPTSATTAVVLGFVAGGLTALVSLALLAAVLGGDDDPATVTLLLGIPVAAGLVAGAARLLGRHSPAVLFASALAAVVVLFLGLAVAAGTGDPDDVVGVSVLLVFGLPLPVLTAVFARLPATVGWAASRP